MESSRFKFQKYVKNLQPSFQQCIQQETKSAIEVSMLQQNRPDRKTFCFDEVLFFVKQISTPITFLLHELAGPIKSHFVARVLLHLYF